jgi:putative addiction module component (TIGR02574 family)
MMMVAKLETFGIDRLSVSDRLELIELIWESLPDEVAADEVPAWHLAELAKRLAHAEANPGAGRPWREALAAYGEVS